MTINNSNNMEDCRAFWNSRAMLYKGISVPNLNNNYIKYILDTNGCELSKTDVLDIGCGTGIWSLALAKSVHSVIGVDISDQMVKYAIENSQKIDVSNTSFICADWKNLLEMEHLCEREFGIVMAHHTPAIETVNDLMIMDNLCSGVCYYTSFVEIKSDMLSQFRDCFNIKRSAPVSFIKNALIGLLNNQRYPHIMYEYEEKNRLKSVEEAVKEYSELEPSVQSDLIYDFFEDRATNGKVVLDYSMISATLSWKAGSDRP